MAQSSAQLWTVQNFGVSPASKTLSQYLLEHLKGKLEFINLCLENKCENAQSYFLRREEVRSVKKRESAEPQSERQVPLKRPERFLLLLWINREED